jgi:hypothetical protein
MLLVQVVGCWLSDDVACDTFGPDDVDATAADEGDVDVVVVDVVPVAGGGAVFDKDVVDEVVIVDVGCTVFC